MSLDIGKSLRVRFDGADRDEKKLAVERIVLLWNMHEGIPTPVLASGAVRKFYDAVRSLLESIEHGEKNLFTADTISKAATASKAWEAIEIEYTSKGRRADCECSEARP